MSLSLPSSPQGSALLPVAPGDHERRVHAAMRVSILEGSIFTVYFNWTSGAVLTGYLMALGAGPALLAAVASLPALIQVANPLMAWMDGRQADRKPYIIGMAAVSRLIWFFPVFIPLLPVSATWRPLILLAVVGVSSFFQTAAGLAWISMMADVVPDSLRGRYFGLRNGICGVVGMVAGLSSGWLLDHMPKPAGFQMVTVGALLFALVGLFTYQFHYERPGKGAALSLRESLLVPLRDRNFRKLILFSAYWAAVVMLASPFVIPYFLDHLKMSFTQVAIWAGIASLCGLFTGPAWGKVADRIGHKTVLVITTFLAGSVHPLCWMIAAPGFLWFVWFSGLVDAFSWGGINTAMFNLTLASAPPRYRSAYVAVLGMVSGLAGFAAGMLSGPLLKFLLQGQVQWGGFTWTGYHSLFLIAGLLRTQAWRLLKPVHEAGSRPASEFLRYSWTRTLNRLTWR